jgi:TonB family protein
MSMLTTVGFLFVLGSLTAVDPLYPPNSVLGATVVAELHFVTGNVKDISILSGESPFVDSCISALAKWHMNSERDADEDALVVVHFRQPYLYYLSTNKEEINPASPKEALPYPVYIVQPSYPMDALGQGCVILLLNTSAEGQVTDVQVIKPMGVLTETSIDAVRKWKFTPAKDEQGKSIPSQAYAVLVYRFPLIVQ